MIEIPGENKNNSPPALLNEPREPAWKEFIRFTLIALAIVIPFRLFIAQPFIVSGASMSPTFETGQYLIIDELTYRFENPKRGDVVILKKPREESEYLIKRIIGLPGETVIIKSGVVSVKDSYDKITVIEEPHVKNTSFENFEVSLGASEYFVMGDNRPVSLDSRLVGPIPRDHIIGRALVRLFPVNQISIFPGVN